MLSDIFSPGRINLDLKGTTKTAALGELVETIAASDSGFDREELLNAVTQRENKMNTIVIPGVAVPHGYCNSIHGVIGAVGFSRSGIEYDKLDRDPVHLIFLLLMDESSRERHLRVLNRLLDLLNSEAFAEINGSGTPQELYDLISRF